MPAGSPVEKGNTAVFSQTDSFATDTWANGTTQTTGSGKVVVAMHIKTVAGSTTPPTSWDVDIQCWDPNGTAGTDWSTLRNNATGDGNDLLFADNITFATSATGSAWLLPTKGASTDTVSMGSAEIVIPTNTWRVRVRPVGGGGDATTSCQIHLFLTNRYGTVVTT